MKNKQIAVLFIIDGLHPGGKERQFIEILKGLNRNDFRIGIITFHEKTFYTEKAKSLCDYFIELDKTKSVFKPFFTIWKCFKHFKPDIVHTWDYLSSMYVFFPAKFYSVKIVNGSIRDSGIEKGLKYYFKKLMIKAADLVISNSKLGLQIYKTKGEVIYNAIDQSRFVENHLDSEFNIIKVANFSEYKNHQMFIDAAIELVKSKVVDKVYLAGLGKFMDKYKKHVELNGSEISSHIFFLGGIANIEEYLRRCSIGVLCSTLEYSEGVSNSVLEYMAAGLVPIATDIGATSEIIEDGLNGFLVAPNVSKEIVEKAKLLKDNLELRNNIVTRAKQTIEQKFNYKTNIYKLMNLYQNLINK